VPPQVIQVARSPAQVIPSPQVCPKQVATPSPQVAQIPSQVASPAVGWHLQVTPQVPSQVAPSQVPLKRVNSWQVAPPQAVASSQVAGFSLGVRLVASLIRTSRRVATYVVD
jgi:hypothetical protein